MRKSKKQEIVEPRVFDVGKNVHQYFNDSVTIEGFIMAVDETGTYFFTTMTDQNMILVKLSNYIEQLDLSKNEIIVCKVFWDAPCVTDDIYFKKVRDKRFDGLQFVDVNPDSFEETVRLILSSRSAVFSKEEVADIVECFQEASLNQNSLYDFMCKKGLVFDKELAEELENSPVINIDDIIHDFGEEHADEIYNAAIEFRETHRCQVAIEQVDLTRYQKNNWELSANITTVLGFLMVIASLVMCIFHVYLLAFIFAFIAFLQSRHLKLIYKTSVATIMLWFSISVIIFSGISVFTVFLPDIYQWLKDNLLVV